MNKILKKLLIILITITIFSCGLALAETTTSPDLHFCEYKGTLQTFKILGLFLTIIKILVPLVLIITAMVDFFKVVTSGKSEDMSASVSKVFKRIIAGIVVFFIPTIINYAFSEVNKIVEYDEGNKYAACRTCLFDTGSCNIPDSDPTTEITK